MTIEQIQIDKSHEVVSINHDPHLAPPCDDRQRLFSQYLGEELILSTKFGILLSIIGCPRADVCFIGPMGALV